MTFHLLLVADDLPELGRKSADLAAALGAGTITPPSAVDPQVLLDVLNAWAEARDGAVRLTLLPRKGRMGRPRYLTVDELDAMGRAQNEMEAAQ